ncbi:hypothetical protein AMELA_G00226000 [Ameiurus melas]|uniref:Uncharacterized protein n=1 Tax=Ameiurus melas TaxID=219545 RepID=A0A7J6A2B1_AMEME|nr:hypothetical protein AMELA_G00226000 [Ameiurus melas]
MEECAFSLGSILLVATNPDSTSTDVRRFHRFSDQPAVAASAPFCIPTPSFFLVLVLITLTLIFCSHFSAVSLRCLV